MSNDGSDFDSFFASAKAEADSFQATRPFTTDCLWIANQAQNSADVFPGIAALVSLSIQQPFWMLPRQVADVVKRDYASPFLWGHKAGSLHYVRANKRALHASARACYEGDKSLDDLILDYLAIPGLGIVKASFLAQMTVGDGACLDTLNLRTLGLREDAFKTPKTLQVKTIRARIAAYNATWRSVGDSAHWWDSWCDLVASRTHIDVGTTRRRTIGSAGADVHAVSRLHRLAITGGIK